MQRKIIIVEQETGEKLQVLMEPAAPCPDCSENDLQYLPELSRVSESFDPDSRRFRMACANCGKILREAQATEMSG